MYEAERTIPSVAKNERRKLQERTLLGEKRQSISAESINAVILSARLPKKHGMAENISIITVLTTHGESPAININAMQAKQVITALVFLPECVLLRRNPTIAAIIEVCMPLTAKICEIPIADISRLKLIGSGPVSPTKSAVAKSAAAGFKQLCR